MQNNDDDRVWIEYAKTVKRVPLKKDTVGTLPPLRDAPERSGGENPNIAPIPQKKTIAPASTRPVMLDKRVERQLRAGLIAPDARLDMHGMTQREAYAALASFIAAQVKRNARNLLIITGKGREGGGVLKSNLKNWFENLPEASRILAVRPAAIRHGGGGAFYVILRRKT